ncbi:MAG: hypothetical protein KAR42_09110 [candidate division Zixibacteria bacterium]|nr:hypothetical protein [candidate division Zixibacteria bacterium]
MCDKNKIADIMTKANKNNDVPLPARFRKTVWVKIHYRFWTLFILMLSPVAKLFGILESSIKQDE